QALPLDRPVHCVPSLQFALYVVGCTVFFTPSPTSPAALPAPCFTFFAVFFAPWLTSPAASLTFLPVVFAAFPTFFGVRSASSLTSSAALLSCFPTRFSPPGFCTPPRFAQAASDVTIVLSAHVTFFSCALAIDGTKHATASIVSTL